MQAAVLLLLVHCGALSAVGVPTAKLSVQADDEDDARFDPPTIEMINYNVEVTPPPQPCSREAAGFYKDKGQIPGRHLDIQIPAVLEAGGWIAPTKTWQRDPGWTPPPTPTPLPVVVGPRDTPPPTPTPKPKADVVLDGEFLPSPGYLRSRKRGYYLQLQSNGNLVFAKGSGPDDNQGIVWESGQQYDQGDYVLFMQSDGNIAVHHGSNKDNKGMLIWHSDCTSSKHTAFLLEPCDDGQLRVFAGRPEKKVTTVWRQDYPSYPIPNMQSLPSTGRNVIRNGGWFQARDKSAYAIMKHDGNFEVRQGVSPSLGGKVRWSTCTHGNCSKSVRSDYIAVLELNGQLEVFEGIGVNNKRPNALFSTVNTPGYTPEEAFPPGQLVFAEGKQIHLKDGYVADNTEGPWWPIRGETGGRPGNGAYDISEFKDAWEKGTSSGLVNVPARVLCLVHGVYPWEFNNPDDTRYFQMDIIKDELQIFASPSNCHPNDNGCTETPIWTSSMCNPVSDCAASSEAGTEAMLGTNMTARGSHMLGTNGTARTRRARTAYNQHTSGSNRTSSTNMAVAHNTTATVIAVEKEPFQKQHSATAVDLDLEKQRINS